MQGIVGQKQQAIGSELVWKDRLLISYFFVLFQNGIKIYLQFEMQIPWCILDAKAAIGLRGRLHH